LVPDSVNALEGVNTARTARINQIRPRDSALLTGPAVPYRTGDNN